MLPDELRPSRKSSTGTARETPLDSIPSGPEFAGTAPGVGPGKSGRGNGSQVLMKKWMISTALVGLVSAQAHASSMKAGCYLQDGSGQDVEGVNVDKRYEIASVSKVMTAYWALKKIGYHGRYTTSFYVKNVSKDLYDVHIVGSRDPYTGREWLQFVAGELNKIGISSIRNLTYDEKFKFLSDVRGKSAAQGFFTTSEPDSDRVMRELRHAVSNLKRNYPDLVARAKAGANLALPKSVSLKVEDIRFRSRADFSPADYTSAYTSVSAPLHAVLKEMNRNSNNHAANQIFESLGGASAFQDFIKADLGLGTDSIRFVNGSGDRKDLEGGGKMYNEATCRAIVRIVRALRHELKKSRKGLEDVMALAGDDARGEPSTTTALYDNDATHEALVAKTGTVNPAVSLAGMISTEEGDIYFGYVYGTKGTASDWRDGRNKIRTQVVKLFSLFGGREAIEFKPVRFLPFDSSSVLRKLENKGVEAKH